MEKQAQEEPSLNNLVGAEQKKEDKDNSKENDQRVQFVAVDFVRSGPALGHRP